MKNLPRNPGEIFCVNVLVMERIKAVILVGGQGTRLRPITDKIPKPLITVHGKPIINYLIDLLSKAGISQTFLMTGNGQREIFNWWKNYYKEFLPSGIEFVPEKELLGTFGGLKAIRDQLKDAFILSNGDELKDFDLKNLITAHRNNPKKPIATLGLVKVPNPSDYGVPIMVGNQIKEFLEKPKDSPSDFISAGIYVLEPEVFKYADPTKKFLMIEKDIFPKLAAVGKLYGHKMKNARWYDCGTFERWEKAIKEW